MKVYDELDLYRLKRLSGLDNVDIFTGALKRANLLRYALKYALWAVKVGGIITVYDDGPRSFDVHLGNLPFSVVRQHAFKAYGGKAELVELDDVNLKICFRRTYPRPQGGWSAGVVYSGNEMELPQLASCLAGLKMQRELDPESGGQVMVVGPEMARNSLDPWPTVEYVPFDEPSSGRGLTPAKKNALVAAARNDKVAIMHTRIVLEPGALAAFPDEFDVATCSVIYKGRGGVVPYLDWVVGHDFILDRVPRRRQSSLFYDRSRYLRMLAKGGLPYIDGGFFVGMRSVIEDVPLHPYLAWGEAEDCEWCGRLHAAGYLVDLEPTAVAMSQTFKLGQRLVNWPRTSAALSRLRRLALI